MPSAKHTPTERAIKVNLAHHAHDTAMHILYNSYLYSSEMWPKQGFKAGHGIGCDIKDSIYVGVNAYGWNHIPSKGALQFNIWNTGACRKKEQIKHIRVIFDYAYQNDLYFEDLFRNSVIETCKFSFIQTHSTPTPTTQP